MNTIKFHNEHLSQTKVVNNILRVYTKATKEDLNKDWYKEAFEFSVSVVSDFDWKVSPTQVVGIVAALSPMCQWKRNKELTISFLTNYFDGCWQNTKCLGASKQKAYQIASLSNINRDDTDLICAILSGAKTSAFFDNIYNYRDSKLVTIDRHALSISLGFKLSQEHFRNYKMTDNHYAFFSKCYSVAAKKMECSPLKMQGVTWVVLRRDHKEALNNSKNLLNLV
ncbi:MAG: hypothetical protein JKX82_04940 [Oleispira sp.]|nr:hypothetical protein [Oleispira sp.]